MKKTVLCSTLALFLMLGTASSVKAATVNFADENGGTNIGSMYWVFNTPTDINVEEPTRDGYTFAGWATDDTDLTIADGQVSVPWGYNDFQHMWTNVDAYATWEAIDYTITYNLDGGEAEGNPDTYTIEDDEIVITNPTKDGYVFTGWTDAEGEDLGMEVTIPSGSTGDIELNANWEIEVYNIAYNLDGGEVEENPDTYTVEDTFTLNNPTKDGYTFVGWLDIDGVDVGTEVTVEEGTTGDLEFTAKWEKIAEEEKKEEETVTKVTNNPKTGDGLVGYILMLTAGIAGIAIALVKKTRK